MTVTTPADADQTIRRVFQSKAETKAFHDKISHVYEWSHRHFPNLVDCRPIFVRQSLEAAGFRIESADKKMMWVPVEVVLGIKADGGTAR